MKKLHLYMISEFFASFILGLFVFTFMFVIIQIMELLDLIINKGVPFNEVFLLFIYILPSFLAITIPMAVLVGILMSFGNIAQNNELIALKTAGISLFKIAKPIIFISLILSCLMVSFNDKVLVWGNTGFRNLYFKIIYEKVQVAMKEKVFITDFPGYIMHIEHLVPKTSKFEDIKIIKLKGTKAQNAIFAKKGELVSDKNNMQVTLKLLDGTIHQLSDKDNKIYYKIDFIKHWINLSLQQTLANSIAARNTGEMTIKNLRNEIKKAEGMEKNILLVEFHKKISIPFACLSFALIGIPLGVFVKKSGKSVGFGLSLILIVIYYAFLIAGVGLGERGQVTAWIAIWSPNVVISLIGIILLIMATKDANLFERK